MDPLCINVNEQVESSQPVKERRGKWLLAGVGMGFFVGAVVGYGATTMHTSAAQIEGIESGIFKFQPGVDIVLEKNSMMVTCAKENHETDFGSALQKDVPGFVPLPGVLPNAPQTKSDAISSHSNRPKHGPTGLTIMNAGDSTFVPDMGRRSLMNALLLGSVAGPLVPVGGVLIAYLTPAKAGGGGGGTLAKDALGNEVLAKKWIADHSNGERNLVQGLKGDATYLIVSSDKTLEKFAVNAVCTHLGCVVPWSKSLNKFACPCHGSQYDQNGKVVRGPAPLSLALAKVGDQDGKVVLSPWTETDFRDGKPPWWKA